MRCDVRPKRGREGRKEGNNNFTFFQSGQSSCQGPTELGEEERDYPGRSFLRLDIQITEGRGEERRGEERGYAGGGGGIEIEVRETRDCD